MYEWFDCTAENYPGFPPSKDRTNCLIWHWCHKLFMVITHCSHQLFEPPHDKTNKMACTPSEDSDQPGHQPSLIRVFAVHMKKAWVLSYPLSAQQRLIRLGRLPGWSESSLGAHVSLLVLSWGGSFADHAWNSCFVYWCHHYVHTLEKWPAFLAPWPLVTCGFYPTTAQISTRCYWFL